GRLSRALRGVAVAARRARRLAVEQRDLARVDLGAPAPPPIGAVPARAHDAALHRELRAALEMRRERLSAPPPDDHVVPRASLALRAALVRVRLHRPDPQRQPRPPSRGVEARRLVHRSDQNRLVETLHGSLLSRRAHRRRRAGSAATWSRGLGRRKRRRWRPIGGESATRTSESVNLSPRRCLGGGAGAGDQASRSDALGRQGPTAPRWDRSRRRGAPQAPDLGGGPRWNSFPTGGGAGPQPRQPTQPKRAPSSAQSSSSSRRSTSSKAAGAFESTSSTARRRPSGVSTGTTSSLRVLEAHAMWSGNALTSGTSCEDLVRAAAPQTPRENGMRKQPCVPW